MRNAIALAMLVLMLPAVAGAQYTSTTTLLAVPGSGTWTKPGSDANGYPLDHITVAAQGGGGGGGWNSAHGPGGGGSTAFGTTATSYFVGAAGGGGGANDGTQSGGQPATANSGGVGGQGSGAGSSGSGGGGGDYVLSGTISAASLPASVVYWVATGGKAGGNLSTGGSGFFSGGNGDGYYSGGGGAGINGNGGASTGNAVPGGGGPGGSTGPAGSLVTHGSAGTFSATLPGNGGQSGFGIPGGVWPGGGGTPSGTPGQLGSGAAAQNGGTGGNGFVLITCYFGPVPTGLALTGSVPPGSGILATYGSFALGSTVYTPSLATSGVFAVTNSLGTLGAASVLTTAGGTVAPTATTYGLGVAAGTASQYTSDSALAIADSSWLYTGKLLLGATGTLTEPALSLVASGTTFAYGGTTFSGTYPLSSATSATAYGNGSIAGSASCLAIVGSNAGSIVRVSDGGSVVLSTSGTATLSATGDTRYGVTYGIAGTSRTGQLSVSPPLPMASKPDQSLAAVRSMLDAMLGKDGWTLTIHGGQK